MPRILPFALAILLSVGSAKADLSLNDDPIAYAVLPAVSARSEFAAIDFINTNDEPAKTAQAVRAIERMGAASKYAANYLYVQNELLKDPQARLLAYRLALSREKQSANCLSLKAPSEFGTELGLFFINSFAINMTEKNKREAERQVEDQMKSQLNGYLEQRISFGISIKNIGDTEREIAGIIDPSVATESIFASKSGKVRYAVNSIIEDQESLAKASWKRLGQEHVYSLLIGTSSKAGQWTFLDGELRSLKADSVSFKGHCVMADLTLELVGQTAGARTMKIRTGFMVFKDGSIGLIGTN